MVKFHSIKRTLWFILGILSVGMAYVGVVVPGIPYSTFVVLAAYCFAKSSPKMHAMALLSQLFGPFLIGWSEKRIFPQKLKYFMLVTMSSSLVMMWFTTHNINAIIWTGGFMILVAIWAWRYPRSEEEYTCRITQGKRIGWFK